jgi:hypothetical protein
VGMVGSGVVFRKWTLEVQCCVLWVVGEVTCAVLFGKVCLEARWRNRVKV